MNQRKAPTKAMAFAALAALWANAQPLPKRDPFIEAARQLAIAYEKSLPDYVVQRSTTRYRLVLSGNYTGQQKIDTVTAEVAVEAGQEVYREIQVDGKPTRSLTPGGSWSYGEFAGQMMMIFGPEHATVFTHPHQEIIRNHPAVRYDFAIDKAHSTWDMKSVDISSTGVDVIYRPACTGKIWIEKGSGQLLAVDMSAVGLPTGFLVTTVNSRTDYDFVIIGDKRYLMPLRSRTVSCKPSGAECLRNETEFRNYEKFHSSTSISFDNPK